MQANSRNALDQKSQMFLISGHDMTVLNVMRALGFDDPLKPDIGASLLFELHAGPPGLGDSTDYVKVHEPNPSSLFLSEQLLYF